MPQHLAPSITTPTPWLGPVATLLGVALALAAGGRFAQRASAPQGPLPAPAAFSGVTPAPPAAPEPPPAAPEPPPAAPEPPAASEPPAPEPARTRAPQAPCLLLRIDHPPNQVQPGPEAHPPIKHLAAWLTARPALPLAARGFADAQGEPLANLEMSARRAQALRAALVRAGIEAPRISVQALGAYAPLPGVPATDGRNRRAELWLLEGECPGGDPLEPQR